MNCKMVATFGQIVILISVASYTTACTGGSESDSINGSIQTNVYVPNYITPLVEQCILLDLKALLTSSMQLTQAQETIIRCYYSYCKNIINMAKLVSTLQSNPQGQGGPPNPTMPGGGAGNPNMPASAPSSLPPGVPDPSVSLSGNVGAGPAGVSASLSS